MSKQGDAGPARAAATRPDPAAVTAYAEHMATQLRKGFLAYCVLVVTADQPRYSSDIIRQLRAADLVVVEGTIYPLLNRLRKDGLLDHQWQESNQGPPRKYYALTEYGDQVRVALGRHIRTLNQTLKAIEKGEKV